MEEEKVPISYLEGLLKELVCPLCNKFMSAPIFICEYGHNICGKCRPRYEHCPIGKASFLEARNFSLENLSRTIKVPCMNRKWGCEAKFIAAAMEEHEKDCEFSLFKCPGGVACPWKGVLEDLKTHIRKTHPENLCEGDFPVNWYGRFGDNNEEYSGIVFALGEIFLWNVGRTDSYVRLLHGFVKHIGLKKNTDKYKYRLTLRKEGGFETMSLCHKVHAFDKTKDEILSTRRCLKAEYSTIKLFLDQNNCTSLEIEISEACPTSEI